ncbi:MAG: acylphosphatase [Euryarchaeota archaeon]|nr:acylphosphatase [Euryarchaeota archaeon]
MKSRVHVRISGKVQGVFFRAHTKQKAEQIGITGWVKNTSDGKVEAVFEGEEPCIQEMLNWCRHGPSHALVEKVDIRIILATKAFETFTIES